VLHRLPPGHNVAQSQIQEFDRCVLARKRASGLDHLPHRHIQRFDGVRRVDHPPNRVRELEQRNHVLPVLFPHLADCLVLVAPLADECLRFLLGLGEAGNFPASIKTVAEWFPKKERALATGIFNAGTNVGALATPLLVPAIVIAWGWYEAFIFTGIIGFIWLAFWLVIYKRPEEHKSLSKDELAYIQSDPIESAKHVPWRQLFPHRQTWAFAIGKFLTDPIWWVYLFWLPDFLNKQHGLDLKNFGIPLAIIYIIADIGSIGGGYISSTLIKRGWTINRSRKTAMLICALAVVPIVFASITSNLWIAVILIGIAAAAHQGWSANIFTLSSDMFPKQAVGSVVGIGGMFGAIGGMIMSPLVGWILDRTGSYVPIFIIAASAYLVALAIIHLLAPKLEPATLSYD